MRRREQSKFSAENYANRAKDVILEFITNMEIEKLAKLARINLSSKEKEKLQKEFEAILNYISALKEVDTGDKEGGFSKRETFNATRLDANFHQAGEFSKELLEGVPFSENGYVKVKHVFE